MLKSLAVLFAFNFAISLVLNATQNIVIFDRVELRVTTPVGLVLVDESNPDVADLTAELFRHDPTSLTLALFVDTNFINAFRNGASDSPGKHIRLSVDKAFKKSRVTIDQFSNLKEDLKRDASILYESFNDDQLNKIDSVFKNIQDEFPDAILPDIGRAISLEVHHETDTSISFTTLLPLSDLIQQPLKPSYCTTQTIFWHENMLLTITSCAPLGDLQWSRDANKEWLEDILTTNLKKKNVNDRIENANNTKGNANKAPDIANEGSDIDHVWERDDYPKSPFSATNKTIGNYINPYIIELVIGYTFIIFIIFYVKYRYTKKLLYKRFEREKSEMRATLSSYEMRISSKETQLSTLNKKINYLNEEISIKSEKSKDNIKFLYSKIEEIKKLKDKNLISSAKFSELIMQFSEDKLRAVNVEVALEFIKDLQANEYISNESYLKINDLICSNYYKKQLSNKYKFW